MSDLNEPNTSPEHLRAEVVASHFINARVAEEDGDGGRAAERGCGVGDVLIDGYASRTDSA